MHCVSCGAYYKLSPYNETSYCDDCLAERDMQDSEGYPDFEVERELLLNPSGKTRPIFYDEDDSHGS